jgi:hypothetical protein
MLFTSSAFLNTFFIRLFRTPNEQQSQEHRKASLGAIKTNHAIAHHFVDDLMPNGAET